MNAFREEYGHVRALRCTGTGDTAVPIRENVVQCIWYDQLFEAGKLATDDGRPVEVLAAGWWNHGEGPDFKGAQLRINGKLRTGDVEIHLTHAAWKQHGHHKDQRYDDVLLNVVLDAQPPKTPVRTSKNRPVPSVLLARALDEDIRILADTVLVDDYPYAVTQTQGRCAALASRYGQENAMQLLDLAGEWRMLNKARAFGERLDRVGEEQALYESIMAACGYSRFKHHFRLLATQLPYERVRQLVQQDPMLAEAALLTVAGLLPRHLPDKDANVPHFERLNSLRRDKLSGLRSLPLEWRYVGVRPTNNPQRRIAGAARFLARTASEGLVHAVEQVWSEELAPPKRRHAFEALFPKAVGFWATHCTWTGKKMTRPAAPLGLGRIRSIIGNVLTPCALAMARRQRDRLAEEKVLDFFRALPKELDNHILKIMTPRIFGQDARPRLRFQTQQGLIQLHQDWCESNPSCRKCSLASCLAPAAYDTAESQ